MSKVDPSFKSKRYRDKLRTEIKGLECLIPIDRSVLHRKLDSQTVFRLIISYFRIKVLFQSLGLHHEVSEEQVLDGKTKDIPKGFFDGQNINQIMDGFLLVATTDGTILYTTENVLQYIGFNQVDLMHRCLYGLVHPDDHFDLKSTLESSFPLSTAQDHSGCLGDFSKTRKDKYVSFICRMKCFNGSAAGYLKMHCSGRIQTIPNFPLKTNTAALNVILLYCQPFMLTGSGCDVSNEAKQNVFWSKHDMDLKIKEFDKKAEEIVGYEADELTESSMYAVVHPEDLAAFTTCHKALIESTEVKTMYFRVICKNGELMWLHSRGKVVSKNSKKFSIVFTHCPVREEDSTFLQQESVARQRYALRDLQCFLQFGHYANDHSQCETDKTNVQKSSQLCTPHIGFTEDMSLSFYSAPTTCPSSWHAMSDRHSPVLPSTHVAHKITQKEKQLQFQEFRRRQQIQMHCNMQSNPFPFGPREDLEHTHEEHVENFKVDDKSSTNAFYLPEKQIKVEPRTESFNHHSVSNLPFGFFDQQNSNVCGATQYGHFDNYVAPFHSCYRTQGNIIPNVSSTVVSPQHYHHFALPFHQNYNRDHSPTNFISYQGIPITNETFRQNGGLHFLRQDTGSMNVCQMSPYVSNGNSNVQCIRKFIKPQANIKLSMHCDYSHPTSSESFEIPVETKYRPLQETITRPRTQSGLTIDGKSCAVTPGYCPSEEIIQYDIEASIHMKIVDNSSSKFRETAKPDPDLPSIGSFLEYLNDA